MLAARSEPVARRLLIALGIALGVAVLFAVWRAGAAEPSFLATPSRYFVKQILSVTFGTLAAPWRGEVLRAIPALALFAALVAGAAGVALARAGAQLPRAASIALALVAWVVAAVAPVYSMLFVSRDLEGGRYLYFASAGWSLLLASALLAPRGRTRVARIVALLVLGTSWAWGAGDRIGDWSEAAAQRDAALASVVAAASGCDRVVVHGAPDNVRGA